MTTTTHSQSFFIECRRGFLDERIRDLPGWFAVRFDAMWDGSARWVQIGPVMIGWETPFHGEPICAGPIDWLASRVRSLLGRE